MNMGVSRVGTLATVRAADVEGNADLLVRLVNKLAVPNFCPSLLVVRESGRFFVVVVVSTMSKLGTKDTNGEC